MVFRPPFCYIYVNTYNSTKVTIHKELAFKYFRGEISQEEERVLHAWIKAEDKNLVTFHNWEEEFARLFHIIYVFFYRFAVRRRRSLWIPFAVAASLLLVAGSIFFFRPAAPQLFAMEAPAGEKCRMTLPDSTIVWLNSESKLNFDDSFNRKDRNVELIGEAYFEVAHNSEKPFIVNCGDVSVLVLGTKFNIEAYPENRFVSASVVEGHVEFSRGLAHIDLYEGQSASYDLLSKVFSRSAVKSDDACAWTESRFVFDDIDIRELTEKLSRI